MDDDELGWIGKLQPFGASEATRWETRLGRCAFLGQALWGRTVEDLRRQLQKPWPEIPGGFDLTDFQTLLRESSKIASLNLDDPRNVWAKRMLSFTGTISIGTQQFTEWEARVEVVRRAIDHLRGDEFR